MQTPAPKVATFGPDLALAVARVDPAASGSHVDIASAWLCGEEHARSARFLVEHARADFLAGRIAAKCAVGAIVPGAPPAKTWEIQRGANQRPVVAAVAPCHAVSIAHAGGVGIAIAHQSGLRCGVDLEPLDREADDVIATQVTPAESAWARAAADAVEQRVRWLLLWTAREAQGKSLGTGILEPERLASTERWQPASPGWHAHLAGDGAHHVRSVIAGGFVASLFLPQSVASDPIAAWVELALS